MQTTIKTSNFINRIKEQFDFLETNLNGQAQNPIHQIRKSAIMELELSGLPNLKTEDWRYTNLAFFNRTEFKINSSISDINSLNEYLIPELESDYIVTINGNYIAEKSKITQSGIKVTSLKSKSELNSLINTIADKKNLTNQVNSAFFSDCIIIEVEKNAILDHPIQILNLISTNENELSNLRILVKCGDSSQAKFLNTYHLLNSKQVINTNVAEFFIGKNCNIENYILQDEESNFKCFTNFTSDVQRESTFSNYTFSLGGDFTRNDAHITTSGENSTANLIGLYLCRKNNLIDNHTKVDHAVPNCQSNEFYKGILDDNSIGVFNGKILVRQDAQKTNAYQSSKSILLSDDAKVNSKPELEIYADDVKCSHGASTGSIDKDSLFYLKARGIGQDLAYTMLLEAYAGEIINKISIDVLKEYINAKVIDILEKK
jgi:Fe-S cluster assembly protein SufD